MKRTASYTNSLSTARIFRRAVVAVGHAVVVAIAVRAVLDKALVIRAAFLEHPAAVTLLPRVGYGATFGSLHAQE